MEASAAFAAPAGALTPARTPISYAWILADDEAAFLAQRVSRPTDGEALEAALLRESATESVNVHLLIAPPFGGANFRTFLATETLTHRRRGEGGGSSLSG